MVDPSMLCNVGGTIRRVLVSLQTRATPFPHIICLSSPYFLLVLAVPAILIFSSVLAVPSILIFSSVLTVPPLYILLIYLDIRSLWPISLLSSIHSLYYFPLCQQNENLLHLFTTVPVFKPMFIMSGAIMFCVLYRPSLFCSTVWRAR